VTYPESSQDPTRLRFRRGETLSEAIQRVTLEQFDFALGLAEAARDKRPEAVHTTRKALKRLRATLRLVRDSIALTSYHTDNEALKLVAAELGAIRDASVLAETLDSLLLPASDEALDPVRHRLLDYYRIVSDSILDNAPHLGSIIEQLESIKKRSRQWSLMAGQDNKPLPHAFSTIQPGLERVYRRGRRAMQNATASPTDTLLHNWRKRAKYLRHQIEALNVLDPAPLSRREGRLETLTDLLGDDHDLAVLTYRLTEDRTVLSGVDPDLIMAAVRHRRHALQQQAIEVGEYVYAAPTEDFLRYVASIWRSETTF
jgi:CHAD domain-containing protein